MHRISIAWVWLEDMFHFSLPHCGRNRTRLAAVVCLVFGLDLTSLARLTAADARIGSVESPGVVSWTHEHAIPVATTCFFHAVFPKP
jgi:hypothetical protein